MAGTVGRMSVGRPGDLTELGSGAELGLFPFWGRRNSALRMWLFPSQQRCGFRSRAGMLSLARMWTLFFPVLSGRHR